MKKIIYSISMLSVIVTLFASCGKDGAIGPAGNTGATGSQGAVGPAGPAGANGQNGSVIYSGTTAPSLSTGTTGDFYLNTLSGLLYGPKTATSWGTGISLKGSTGSTGATGATGSTGATGATGATGSKIYSGTVVPAATLGANGDYYLDKTNYLLYGPKTSGSWGTPVNLQGPAGPQGPEGNANVKTDVFSIGGADWIWNSSYVYESSSSSYTEYFTRYYDRKNSAVTQDILDNGVVMVYFTPSPTFYPNIWAPLPYQFDYLGAYTTNYVYTTAPGVVTMQYFFVPSPGVTNIPDLSTYNDETRKFKIVTIAGTALSLVRANHVNLNDYSAVSKITGLWQQDKN